MTSRLLPERARHNLVQMHRGFQAMTWAAGTAFLLVVMFADPGHHIALGAIDAVFHLFNLILC